MKPAIGCNITILASLFCLLFSKIVISDEIYFKNGEKKTCNIVSISKDEISCKSGKMPIAELKSCRFDNFAVATKKTGIILTDGTTLSGIILKRDGKIIEFRSVSLGLLKFSEELVAAEYYGNIGNYSHDWIFPSVIDVTGNVFNGKILWCDSKSTAVMTNNGLKKVPADEVLLVCRGKTSADKKIILRNSDIINLPAEFSGEKIKFKFENVVLDLPVSAVSVINFSK